MTIEQVNHEFAGVEMKFHSYFKFSFEFIGVAEDGRTIVASVGGTADAIYREKIEAAESRSFGKCERWTTVTVTDGSQEMFFWMAD